MKLHDYLQLTELFDTSIDEEVAHYPESKGILRDEMPQIESKNLNKFIDFLKSEGVNVQKTEMKVKDLKPTQKEFNPEKVEKLKSAPLNVLNKLVIISSDNYIMDGHHRYSALKELDSDNVLNVAQADTDINNLLKLGHKFPESFTKDINEKKQTEA